MISAFVQIRADFRKTFGSHQLSMAFNTATVTCCLQTVPSHTSTKSNLTSQDYTFGDIFQTMKYVVSLLLLYEFGLN